MAALSDKQFIYLGGAVIGGLILLTWAGRKAVVAASDATVGAITGNNAITEGTPYQGAGILGTLGAVTNEASGGTLQKVGEYLGGKMFDWFGPKVGDQGGQVIDADYKVLQQLNSEKTS